MNGALYERIVARKPKPYDLLIRIVVILLIIAVIVLGMPFIGLLAFVIAVILAMLAYYFVSPRLSVEYEYILLNHDLQIDIIYNRAKRKSLRTFDIQGAEIIAPKSSPRLNSYKPDKVYDYSSGGSAATIYPLLKPMEQQNGCIYIQPDPHMVDPMKQWVGQEM